MPSALDALTYLSTAILESHQERLLELISKGYDAFYREMFGDEFVDGFDSLETSDTFHTDAVEWHWEARLALLRGGRPPDDHWVYFPTWPRGYGKSSVLKKMLVVDALLTYAYGQRGYALIPGGTSAKVRGGALSLEKSLSESKILEYCPALSRVEKNVAGHSRGWSKYFLSTQAGYVFHFIGLDEGVAGANVDNVRVTFLAPDDIDSREDSPVISESRFRTLTTEILPTRQANTLTFWAQNLISRYSVRYRVESQQERILTNRKPSVAVPAVRNPVWEQKTIDGIVRDVIVAGNVTWRKWDLQRVNDEVATMGRDAFEKEMQHNVESSKEGLILYNYNDTTHVISQSEFTAIFGKDAWLSWRKKPGNDWARTKTDKHANVACWQAVSPQDSPLPNFTFLMHPMSFPAESAPEDVAERLLTCLSKYAYDKVTWSDLRKQILRRSDADTHTQGVAEKMAYERGALAKVIPKYARPLLYKCNVQQGDMSHEATTPRQIYGSIYGIGMKPVNPKKHGGIEFLNREMAIDWDTAHPFRPDQKGYTTWFMVVPDAVGVEGSEINGQTVFPPKSYPLAIQTKDLHDDDLARFHLSNFRYREPVLTASGEAIDDPLKLYDDFPQMLQQMAVGSQLRGTQLSREQKVKMLMPAETIENLKTAKTGNERLSAALDYEFALDIAEATLDPNLDDAYSNLE